MQRTSSQPPCSHGRGLGTRRSGVTSQYTCHVVAARTAKALTLVERGRRAVENADLAVVEIELSAALAELPKIALHLRESSSP